MDGPFEYGGAVPGMDMNEIYAHIKDIDPELFWRLCNLAHANVREDKSALLAYLRTTFPLVYKTLEDILRTFQSCYHVACEARHVYIANYHCYKLMERATVEREESLEVLMQRAADEQFGDVGEKRRQNGEPSELVDQDGENMRRAVKKLRKGDPLTPELFYAQENFSDDFDINEYRHFVKKGRTRYSIGEIADWGRWHTIYHCNGPWNAEELVESLKAQNQFALVVKKIRGADAEVMGYKVLAGDFYPPPE